MKENETRECKKSLAELKAAENVERVIRRTARNTLTPIEMFHGDALDFKLLDGSVTRIALNDTGAEIMSTTLETPGVEASRAMTTYRFWGDFTINGTEVRLEREVGTQKSFYEPWNIGGVMIWLDAVDAIFTFMRETHGPCRLNRACSHRYPEYYQARLAVQDATARICPDPLHPWCPLPPGGLRIEDCYRGEDCWMGAYDGASAHGGLDINHPKGTPLYAPLDCDDQFLFRRVADGYTNNSWRGLRYWPNGSVWTLRSAHMTEVIVPEHAPLPSGTHYAHGAGVLVGSAEHSHFCFTVHDLGDTYLLDPWILFRQMYLDQ